MIEFQRNWENMATRKHLYLILLITLIGTSSGGFPETDSDFLFGGQFNVLILPDSSAPPYKGAVCPPEELSIKPIQKLGANNRNGVYGRNVAVLVRAYNGFPFDSVKNEKGELVQPQKEKLYDANWESIDKRPLPKWFNEAKFGIFIVWGPYSVPAWAPASNDKNRTNYSEWYGHRVMYSNDKQWKEFHEQNYGKDFKYEQFAPMLKGELFDADEWAHYIAASGAKYTAFCVNYHDGFAMWPTEYAKTMNTDKWNTAVIGPMRDVTKEVKEAVEKKGVDFGIYYSLTEWWHPLMRSDKKEEFALNWLHPKFKEVVSEYEPCFIFLDGDWDADSKTWHTEELAAWLYNDSPVSDNVVVNDRWGKETRGVYGDIYSSEYGGAKGFDGHPWQEDRGIGKSYGYRRNENLEDYKSGDELIELLTRCIMNGGNLLLDIGPAADGTIPVIMQQRLIEIGDWLKVNGEAIYGTTAWKVRSEGKARYSAKGDCLYAICMDWPGKELVLDTPKPKPDTEITMLGYEGKVNWQMVDGKLHIRVPQLTIDQLPCKHAWVFKIPHDADR